MGKLIKVSLKVRRYDLADDPVFEDVTLELDSTVDYQTLKKQLYAHFKVTPREGVIKLRNMDHFLLPLGELLNEDNDCFIIDVATIKYTEMHNKLINKKIGKLLQRLNQLEELAKDAEWRKQAHTEENINVLTERVEFLNRRYDQLLPASFKQHLQK